MRSILKREVKNYMKNPLLWLGIVIGVFMVFQNVSPYLNIHYLREGENIVNDYPQNYRDGDVSCGYVPTEDGESAASGKVGRTDTGSLSFRIRDGQ